MNKEKCKSTIGNSLFDIECIKKSNEEKLKNARKYLKERNLVPTILKNDDKKIIKIINLMKGKENHE